MSDYSAYPCPSCQIGYCQPGSGVYLRVVDGLLVSAPDLPLFTCDICQYQEFDSEIIACLEAALGLGDSSLEAQRVNAKMPPVEPPDSPEARRPKHGR